MIGAGPSLTDRICSSSTSGSTLAFNRSGRSRMAPGVSVNSEKLGGVHVQVCRTHRPAEFGHGAQGLFVKQMETFASVADEDTTVKASSPETLHGTLHEGAEDSNPDLFKRQNAEYYSAV